MNSLPPPKEITLHKGSKTLEVVFDSGAYHFPFEFLRVYSPSAEVRGHGNQAGTLPLNKNNVLLINITQQGNYALRLTFDDGHDSGIYSWDYIKELGENQEAYWRTYTKKAEELISSQQTSTIKWIPS